MNKVKEASDILNFIKEHQHLFWYSSNTKNDKISDEFLIETVLNYGSMDDIRGLFSVMGIKNTAKVFFNSINKSDRKKNNYNELTINYFTLLFNRYAA